ncbi:MAG: hypothetical protein AAFQ19_06170 [Pseudomonadota bacterium]
MTDGFAVFAPDLGVAAWAQAARARVPDARRDPAVPQDQLRHGRTWFVGLDALPNDAAGAVDGVPLPGAWRTQVPDVPLHRAQVSVIYPGYPRQDVGESDANHRFRIVRKAAHVDGLLPIGPDKRRYAKELHAYILAIPLNACTAAPTVVWRGSHVIMQNALRTAIAGRDPRRVDVTEAYHAARRQVFEACEMVPLRLHVGQVALIHRFALHGTERWEDGVPDAQGAGRIIAFFRPEGARDADWLSA